MLLKRVVDAGFAGAYESSDNMLGPVSMGNTCVIALKPNKGE
jgi:hypothetical protein